MMSQTQEVATTDLQGEVSRLREENADLRASSLMYLALAERLARRVRELEKQPRTTAPVMIN